MTYIGTNLSSMAHRSSSFARLRYTSIAVLAVLSGGIAASPALAATCQFVGGSQFGGVEAPLAVDGVCTDPDYNSETFVRDSSEQKTLTLPDGTSVTYTEVRGHFPATRTQADLPAGITQSPTTARHSVVWRFPERRYFRNRFFQQTYPLNMEMLNSVDSRFAFITGGGYTVGITPGSPNVGYRVPAAAAKLAKDFARNLYGDTGRIYGYLYGQSGGSVQSIGAAENTTGVWDGIVPVVIATDGLNVHSFLWGALYALAIPEAKRQAIAEAAAPGSGRDIYAGLTADERSIVNELLSAGFPRNVLESMSFSVDYGRLGSGTVRTYDPDYEDDFWTKPGYEGANPPAWLAAAKVDGYATIAGITRNAQGIPSAIAFDPATMPELGSIGAAGLDYYVFAADGTTRIVNREAVSLSGKLEENTLALAEGKSDPRLLDALAVGVKIRVTNRFSLAAAFYPRHSIFDNGNPAYNQYRNADATSRYVQRPRISSLPIAFLNNIRTAGGVHQTGRLRVKTIAFENLTDGFSYPFVAGFYVRKVRQSLGGRKADEMLRVYYQENGIHGVFLDSLPGKPGTATAATGGTLHQVLLDLAAWAERGIPPMPSTRYQIDIMNQVILPEGGRARGGYQPVLRLTVNGADRIEVGVNQPVNLNGRIEMPPKAGKIVEYDWYLGGSDFKFEPATKLPTPQARFTAARTVSFAAPGEYIVTLRVVGHRGGNGDTANTTPLINIDRVRIVVR